ncbi:MAG TPA: hypothetical protein VIV60_36915, partial [Polyangiaceae bacterium]
MQARLLQICIATLVFFAGCWLAFDAAWGILLYTSQGDLCTKLSERARRGEQVRDMAYCAERHANVHRAYIVEVAVALGGVGFSLWLMLRRTNRYVKGPIPQASTAGPV